MASRLQALLVVAALVVTALLLAPVLLALAMALLVVAAITGLIVYLRLRRAMRRLAQASEDLRGMQASTQAGERSAPSAGPRGPDVLDAEFKVDRRPPG